MQWRNTMSRVTDTNVVSDAELDRQISVLRVSQSCHRLRLRSSSQAFCKGTGPLLAGVMPETPPAILAILIDNAFLTAAGGFQRASTVYCLTGMRASMSSSSPKVRGFPDAFGLIHKDFSVLDEKPLDI